MFLTILGFLSLSAVVVALVGGTLAARKYLQVVSSKGDIELTKAKIQAEELSHSLKTVKHQNKLKLLALTEGDTKAKGRSREAETEADRAGSNGVSRKGQIQEV